MLGSLIATLLICIGVANTTPICNYAEKQEQRQINPKKANIVNNYTMTITPSNTETTTRTVLGTGNSQYTDAIQKSTKKQLYETSSYLNVIGNVYTDLYTKEIANSNNVVRERTFIDNVEMINSIGLRTCTGYLMKITAYNYNINTNETIKLRLSVGEFTDINDEDFFAYEIYYKRYIYKVNESLDSYINLQNYMNATQTIKYEIENVNNGFYYTLDEELVQIGYNEADWQTDDEFELEMQPNADNYYFIIYRPCARFVYNTTNQTQPMNMSFPNAQIVITGTNIIPGGTYEVVDIPGLMFEIIGMPFAFVSQAFNLTLFPGTPYQINIANLFLSIMAVFIFVWIITIIIKIKAGG